MIQLSISIPYEKLNFILELFKNFGFVKIESVDGKPYDIELIKEEINSQLKAVYYAKKKNSHPWLNGFHRHTGIRSHRSELR